MTIFRMTVMASLLALTFGQADAQQSRTEPSPREALLNFVTETSAMAGAAAVCVPAAYDQVRLCGVLVISNWGQLGNRMPTDRDIGQVIERTWITSAGNARNVQAGTRAPMNCERLMGVIRVSPLWQSCDAARAIQAEAVRQQSDVRPQSAPQPPSQARPQNVPQPQNIPRNDESGSIRLQ